MLGLLALPFGVFAPFAIVSGARSLRRIRASGGDLRGEASAAAGLAAGIVALATILVGVGYWVIAS